MHNVWYFSAFQVSDASLSDDDECTICGSIVTSHTAIHPHVRGASVCLFTEPLPNNVGVVVVESASARVRYATFVFMYFVNVW